MPSSRRAWLSPLPGATCPPRQPGVEGPRPVTKAQLDKGRESGREGGCAHGRPRPRRQDVQWPHALRWACGGHVGAPCGPGGFGASERCLGNLKFSF